MINLDNPLDFYTKETCPMIVSYKLSLPSPPSPLSTIKIKTNENILRETHSFHANIPIENELIKIFGKDRISLLDKEIKNLLEINLFNADFREMIKFCLVRIAVKIRWGTDGKGSL